MSTTTTTSEQIFVTGASGYVGGRLAPRLLERGYSIRCLVRSIEKVRHSRWAQDRGCELIEGDVSDSDRLADQMRGCGVAYYLIHSMVAVGKDYAERDRRMAEVFAHAAQNAGIRRIIYLGGLGELGEGLSDHLKSRRDVEDALAVTQVPVTVLRAAMIIGSGSASFEILRYLVERLPIMITPKWVVTECQPIAIDNVLDYLPMCLTTPATVGKTLDIGGPDVMSYRELMRVMEERRGLPRRWIIPVPVLTPRLSSLWIHLVTPLSAKIARPLAEGLRNRVVCRNDEAARLMPQRLLGVSEAIALALSQRENGETETSWSSAGEIPGDPDWAGGKMFIDERKIDIEADQHAVFRAVCAIGGENGWFEGNWLWRVRGVMDRLMGGPGLRRGRRHPQELFFGDALDFWRVVEVETDRRLVLRAEMKLPGEAELCFEVTPKCEGKSRLVQSARFRPRGLLGLAYWYAVLPLHGFVFNSMLRGLKQSAERRAAR